MTPAEDDTKNCPASQPTSLPPQQSDHCVSLAMINGIVDKVNKTVDKVNDVMDLANTALQHVSHMNAFSAGDCNNVEAWIDIWDKMEEIMQTGFVWKRMYKPDNTSWPDPDTSELVDQYDQCDGFWRNTGSEHGSLSLITSCLSVPGVLPPNGWTCLTWDNIKSLSLVLDCMHSQKCHPSCDCPVCGEEGDVCASCDDCFTVVVDIECDTAWWQALAFISGGAQCTKKIVNQNMTLRDGNNGQAVANAAANLYTIITGTSMYAHLYGVTPNGNNFRSGWVEILNKPDTPHPGCEAIETPPLSGGQNCDTSVIAEGKLAKIGATDNCGKMKVYYYMGRPACDQKYAGCMGANLTVNLPAPTDWNGNLPRNGEPITSPMGWLANSSTHWTWQGDEFDHVKLTYNYNEASYELLIEGHYNDPVWFGRLGGCTGAVGTYTRIAGRNGTGSITVSYP